MEKSGSDRSSENEESEKSEGSDISDEQLQKVRHLFCVKSLVTTTRNVEIRMTLGSRFAEMVNQHAAVSKTRVGLRFTYDA